MANRTIGFIDGLLFLVTWSFVAVIFASHWHETLPIILFILFPLSAVVSWQGSLMAQDIRDNNISISGAAQKGFIWGFIVSALFMARTIASQVFAAGGALEGYPFFSKEVGYYIFSFALPISIGGGVLGAIHGIAFYYLNLKIVGSQQVAQADAATHRFHQ